MSPLVYQSVGWFIWQYLAEFAGDGPLKSWENLVFLKKLNSYFVISVRMAKWLIIDPEQVLSNK